MLPFAQEIMVENNPQDQIKIHIPNNTVLPLETSSSLLSSDFTNKGKEKAVMFSSSNETLQLQHTSQTLSDEVDSTSLLHQTTIETSSFHIEPSQPPHPPSPPVVAAVAENETPKPNLKTELKVATSVIMISSGAIASVVSGLVGNEKATLNHKILFKAFSILNYISFVLGVGLSVLIFTRPTIPGFVKITKFVMWIAIGSITYALGCATCLLLPKLVEVVLVLVAPLVIVCLIAALSLVCRNKIPHSVVIPSVV